MRVIILGGDGYLGWPTAMHLAKKSNKVLVIDNYSRRKIAKEEKSLPLFSNIDLVERSREFYKITKKKIGVKIFDCKNYYRLSRVIRKFKPDAIVHYAEQPSAPYSMVGVKQARYTLQNNLEVTFNTLWSVIENCPKCHIIKLGTMGEYGTPNIDIEEGWLNIKHNNRRDKFLFPRQASSLYHTTKILDTDLIWFYVRYYNLKVTDLMQGPVYGLETKETKMSNRLLPNFHYDDIFGTVVNRFLVQAIVGHPLTVYGNGNQKRGYINLIDSINCIELALKNPPKEGMRILNQFTETFTVNQLAKKIKKAAKNFKINVKIESLKNPRQEKEKHYYNPKFTGLKKLGLKPTLMTEKLLINMLNLVIKYKSKINQKIILPRVSWNK